MNKRVLWSGNIPLLERKYPTMWESFLPSGKVFNHLEEKSPLLWEIILCEQIPQSCGKIMIIVGKFPYCAITVFFSVQVNLPCSDGESPYCTYSQETSHLYYNEDRFFLIIWEFEVTKTMIWESVPLCESRW